MEGESAAMFRLHAQQTQKPSVGPGTYQPTTAHLLSAPAPKFSQAHRFLPSKCGYISPRHNSDLLCTASPGPKYHIVPSAATYPRQPALSWGEKQSVEQREKKQQVRSLEASDVGPAAYTPRVAQIKPSAPRCAFSRSDRFGGPFGSYQTLNNSTNSATMYHPKIDTTIPQSPRYSFGHVTGPGSARDGAAAPKQKPRTSFMTHSIRGGLAKPATLECNIAPTDYSPRTGDIGENQTQKYGFGSSTRFIKAGLQYISSEHAKANVGQAGPGPKYLVTIGTTSYQPKAARTSGLQWIP